MDKSQAVHDFWSSFGLTAYDENAVPDNAQMPYITYSVVTDSLEYIIVIYHNFSLLKTNKQTNKKNPCFFMPQKLLYMA